MNKSPACFKRIFLSEVSHSESDYKLVQVFITYSEEEGTSLIGKRNIEFTMPHLHSNVLLDDSELGDGMCRPTKVRKPRKSSSTNQVLVIRCL